MRAVLAVLAAAVCSAIPSTAAAAPLDGVSVEIEPARTELVLGAEIELSIAVTNQGDTPTEPLLLHIDITDPSQSTSVDPEDWTPTLTRRVGVVGAGRQVTVTWPMQPIAGGDFAVYATVFTADADVLVASAPVHVVVAERRSLDPGGILPVALGAPLAVGALLVVQTRVRHRCER